MLIDRWLPEFDYLKQHDTAVPAGIATTYEAMRTMDLAASPIVRGLFLVRGMTAPTYSIDTIVTRGFVLLEERWAEEIVLGIVAQPWKPKAYIEHLDPREFAAFAEPGFVKVAWNFTVAAGPAPTTRLATETRIVCTDGTARRNFGRYWAVIGPFSAITRREMLRMAKRNAEELKAGRS